MNKYIIAKGRSIVTKKGILGQGESVDEKIGGENFQEMINRGWLIKDEGQKIEKEPDEIKYTKVEIKPIESENIIEESIEEKEVKIKTGAKKK
jgi:hypothetical protein